METKLDSYYFGMIMEVFAPTAKENASKYQTEYQVLITADDYAQLPVRCIVKDMYGTRDDFEDIILTVGSKVMVCFPRGDRQVGIIQHGTRQYINPQDPKLGRHWRNRFNKIVRYIDKDGNYSVTSDQGPNLHVKVDKIVLDDSVGEQVILDKTAKTIFINCKDFTIDVKQNINMKVGKDSTVAIQGNSQITVQGNATVNITGDLIATAKNIDVTAQQSAKVKCKEGEITASGQLKLNGKKIIQNKEMSGMTTENSHMGLIDLITGVPVVASKTNFGDV
jgi:hypothetical protein